MSLIFVHDVAGIWGNFLDFAVPGLWVNGVICVGKMRANRPLPVV